MAKKSTAPTRTYVVVYPIKHDGERYNAGDTVDMPADQGAALVARGTLIEEASAPSQPPVPPTPPTPPEE